jgi:putative Holliday junction resolvase
MRVIALDHGLACCGVAVCDPTGTLARPLEPIERPDSRAGRAAIARLVRELEAEQVLVGLPLSLSGQETEQSKAARDFAARLARSLGSRAVVALCDERLTTRLAAARARERPGERPRHSEHSRAAAALLETWLSRHCEGRVR